MSTVRCFAYGSNMLRERLAARCPSVIALGRGELRDHVLTFDKPSVDGSGKCGVRPQAGSVVQGVIWELQESELAGLDEAEGVGQGYERRIVAVYFNGSVSEALCYVPTKAEPGRVPYDWYLSLVLSGAEEQHLPVAYIDSIRATQVIRDPKADRPTRLQAIEALRRSGLADRADELEKSHPTVALQNETGV